MFCVFVCLFHYTFVFWTFISNDQLWSVIIYIMYLIHYIVQPLNFCEKFVVMVTPLDNTLLFRLSVLYVVPPLQNNLIDDVLQLSNNYPFARITRTALSLFLSFALLVGWCGNWKVWILFISRDERVVLTFNGGGGHFDFFKGWNVKKQLSVNHIVIVQ